MSDFGPTIAPKPQSPMLCEYDNQRLLLQNLGVSDESLLFFLFSVCVHIQIKFQSKIYKIIFYFIYNE